MAGLRQWRPIAECPPNVRRAVVFDPEMAYLARHDGSVIDERAAMAERHVDGRWYVERDQGGDFYRPTHFLDPGVPKDHPVIPDGEQLRAQAQALEEERRQARARAEQDAVERERGIVAHQEAFWADPEKRLRALSGDA